MAGPIPSLISAVATVAKTLPRAVKASEAVNEAKAIETQIAKILDKPKVTSADVKKAETLAQKADDILANSGASKKAVSDVRTGITNKVNEVKSEAPAPKSTVKAPTADAAKAQAEAKAAASTPAKATVKETAATPAKTAAKEVTPTPAARVNTTTLQGIAAASKVLLPGITAASLGEEIGIINSPKPTPVTPTPVTPSPSNNGIPSNVPIPKPSDSSKEEVTSPSPEIPKEDDLPGPNDFPNLNSPRANEDNVQPPNPDNPPAEEDTFEQTWLILRAKLLAAGLPVKTVNDSVTYFRNIIKDGKFSNIQGATDEISNVVDQYLYLPSYTNKSGEVIESPFYRDFGKYNESLKVRKQPKDLVSLVLGYQQLVDKYQVSEQFKSENSITKYLQNEVSVSELDERMNTARLRSITSDPKYIETLKTLGFINKEQDLTDFFLDPSIGTLQLESNRKTAAFATEAARRQNAGVALTKSTAVQQASRLAALGYTESQITQLAAEGYQNIAEQLNPVVAYSGMFEKTGQTQEELTPIVQQELEQEQFMNMASSRRKVLSEQYARSLQGQSGSGRFGQSTRGVAGAF